MKSTVLVTGGTGAIGTVVTKRLISDGYRVAATWLHGEEPREHLLQARGSPLIYVRSDVTDPASIADALQEIESRLGGVDALVHLVGAWSGAAPVHQHSPEDWQTMLDVNLTSAFLCSRAVLPGMLKRSRGRIVFTSSRDAETGPGGQAAYSVAKAGLEVLAKTIAEENKCSDVTANLIAPSVVDTPANRKAMPAADFSSWVLPEQIAASISFLVADGAGALRGARLPLYGGV